MGMVSIINIEKVWVPVHVLIVCIPQSVLGEEQIAGFVGVNIWAVRGATRVEGAGSDAGDLDVSGLGIERSLKNLLFTFEVSKGTREACQRKGPGKRERMEVQIIESACELIHEDLDLVVVRCRHTDSGRLKVFSTYKTTKQMEKLP